MPPETPDPTTNGVRLLGGILSVLFLSIVAIVLKAADTADRSRASRSHEHHRRDAQSKPWTASMAATSIDESPIRRTATPRRTAA